MLDKFISALHFNIATWFSKLNFQIKQNIKAEEIATLDETMWPQTGDNVATVHIERKPEPDGFKVLSLCLQLTKSSRYFIEQN